MSNKNKYINPVTPVSTTITEPELIDVEAKVEEVTEAVENKTEDAVKTEEPVIVEEPKVEEPVVETVVTEVVKEEPKKPVIEEEPKKPVPPVVPEVKKEVSSSQLNVNDVVTLKEGATAITGAALPTFAFKNKYKVTKITDSRIIITAGNKYTIAVSKDSLVRE